MTGEIRDTAGTVLARSRARFVVIGKSKKSKKKI